MTVAECLLKAREIIAAGWCEPTPRTVDGKWTHARDEDAALFDVDSALWMASGGDRLYLEAHDLLESILAPSTAALNRIAMAGGEGYGDADVSAIAGSAAREWNGLADWLEQPERSLAHVLRLFDRALLRAKNQEAA